MKMYAFIAYDGIVDDGSACKSRSVTTIFKSSDSDD